MKTIFFWITTLAFILAGCQDSKIQQPEPPLILPASPTPAASAVPTRTLRVEIAATIQPPADSPGLARADLAERLGIPAGEIMILAVINQDFSPDGFYCRSSKERTSKEGVVESRSPARPSCFKPWKTATNTTPAASEWFSAGS